MSYCENDGLYGVIDTEKGKIVVQLEFEKIPMTVSNFVGLVEGVLNLSSPDEPFYDGLNFHRVIENFMIQGGCPNGTGTGGPGYKFPDEFDDSLKHDKPGILSMANAGPGTNGSQFFITHVPTPWLDGKHTIFGHVVEGMNTVNSIEQGDRINSIVIERVGEKAKAFTVTKDSFEELVKKEAEKVLKELSEKDELINKEIKERWPDAVKTASGLRYKVLKKGSGTALPEYGKEVTVHYEGRLMNNKLFDSSIVRKKPATFKIGEVIEGWNEALLTMRKGEKRVLIIPPELGYGIQGYPGVIPPNSFLIFDVELLDF